MDTAFIESVSITLIWRSSSEMLSNCLPIKKMYTSKNCSGIYGDDLQQNSFPLSHWIPVHQYIVCNDCVPSPSNFILESGNTGYSVSSFTIFLLLLLLLFSPFHLSRPSSITFLLTPPLSSSFFPIFMLHLPSPPLPVPLLFLLPPASSSSSSSSSCSSSLIMVIWFSRLTLAGKDGAEEKVVSEVMTWRGGKEVKERKVVCPFSLSLVYFQFYTYLRTL